MSKIGIGALAALFFCAPAMAAPPIEAYGNLPTLSNVTLSPDGNSLAYVRGNDTHRYVTILTLGSKTPPADIEVTGKKVRLIQWAGSNNVIIASSETTVARGTTGDRQEYPTALYYDLKTKSLHPLIDKIRGLNFITSTANVIAGNLQSRVIDGRPYVFVPTSAYVKTATYGGTQTEQQISLLRVDLDKRESVLVSPEDRHDAQSFLVDAEGNIVAEEDFTKYTQHWQLVLYKGGQVDKTVMDEHAPVDQPSIVGLSEDGTAVVEQMPPNDKGEITYKQVSLKDGVITPWPREVPQAGGVVTGDLTGRVIGIEHSIDKNDYSFFDAGEDALWKSVKATFPGAINVARVDTSEDKTKALVHVFGLSLGEGYFLIDRKAKTATPVGLSYDGIKEYYPQTWIDYKAADGRLLHGYLTMPAVKGEAKNLPMIMLPHGGPFARDEPGFDWLSQSFASRGYVVLQPEFRGSDGFGHELLTAGFGEYGKKMQTDLSDGVRALVAKGLVDPKRVCILGASYGGYAALAGATLDTGVYRCAVSIAGLGDMKAKMGKFGRAAMAGTDQLYWNRFLGVEDGKLGKLDAISPVNFIDRVSIPILLIHGRDDTRVEFSQSQNMADALKSAGKTYQFVILDHEDHFLSTGATRLQALKAAVDFVEKYNPAN